ncbi:unnamed protein product [Paramecium sonneborni]|uniref:Transmembrane protein n=1 Tax=Paramecium sonneborni TaxID=65129 RepID=A0A8S1M7T0_9CILI|nr:unnamed protein product [Paramecium sonneborni]
MVILQDCFQVILILQILSQVMELQFLIILLNLIMKNIMLCNTMYGQMAAGRYCQIGSQGIEYFSQFKFQWYYQEIIMIFLETQSIQRERRYI